ncbi:MAG: glutaredoxin family protein [Candidatus Woesearchaeota archaeon]
MKTKKILLQLPTCPYCARARGALDEKKIEYEIMNVKPDDRTLVKLLSGQESVPILVEVVGSENQDVDIEKWAHENF